MVNVTRVCRRPLRSTTSPTPPAAQGTKTSRMNSNVVLASTAASAGAITSSSRAPRYSIDLGGQGFMSFPCYHPCCQCCYQRLRIPTSLGRGSNSVGGNSSDYFFQCLNSCSNPRHVATIDHNLHAK